MMKGITTGLRWAAVLPAAVLASLAAHAAVLLGWRWMDAAYAGIDSGSFSDLLYILIMPNILAGCFLCGAGLLVAPSHKPAAGLALGLLLVLLLGGNIVLSYHSQIWNASRTLSLLLQCVGAGIVCTAAIYYAPKPEKSLHERQREWLKDIPGA